ncbi:MAG: hypothetical protein LBS40_08700 [Burkholderiales bacterium]|jgi:hypothetical protein|nr:hypothetical protein [Burkholderiales bacterium]
MVEKMMLLKKSMMFLALLFVLGGTGCTSPSHYEVTIYDRMRDGLFPPYIPGTENQMEARVQVVDISTKQPIADAIVVGRYDGPDGRGGITCFASESAVTDENGYAYLPNDRDERVRGDKNWRRGPRLVSAYKRGYQLVFYPPFRSEYRYQDNAWYVYESYPPEKILHTTKRDEERTAPWSTKRLPTPYPDERSALIASKERGTIYLYPSTATTQGEKWKELDNIAYAQGCGRYLPFAFSKSEGSYAIAKAVYQEMTELGFSESSLKYFENSYLFFFRNLDRHKSKAQKQQKEKSND